ncbi:MAG: alpha/beta fold hydrolase [Myxococcales bacterium]|nr:MAG: alpha/beta fold hydrolase [Myxococcales bacterium]
MLARAAAISCSLIFASACQRTPAGPQPAASAQPAPSATAAVPELDAVLHLPPQKAGQKAPLLVLLHGLGSSGQELAAGSDWPTFAEAHGIAWVAPNGPFDRRGRRFWAAGPECCNFDQLPVDHVAALGALITRLGASAGVDGSRVYVGGHSNGGFMAHRLACERPDLVRGIVAIAGTGPMSRSACKAPGSLRVLHIHGEQDPIVTYPGGHLFRNSAYPEHLSAQRTASDWAQSLGCDPTPSAAPALNLETQLPGAETRVDAYQHCKAGAVELWSVAGAAHYLGFRAPAPEAVWAFLSQ